MKRKPGFVLYLDYKQHLELLSDEECGLLLRAIFEYEESSLIPEFSGAMAMAFSFISANLDRDREKYEATRQKRIDSGHKGGRPPKGKEPFEE